MQVWRTFMDNNASKQKKIHIAKKGFITVFVLIIATFALYLTWQSYSIQRKSKFYMSDGRPIVRVSMYNSSSYPAWRAYVEKKCADVFISWEDNRNNTYNVLYQAKNNDIPDIISIRRFESDSARVLETYLLNLDGLPIIRTFTKESLEPYRSHGKQFWLPAPGLVDGFVANADVFQKYALKFPVDFKSFIDTCVSFQQHGKRALTADLKQDWTSNAILEGFALAPFFTAQEGRFWCNNFTEGKTTSVDEEGFGKVADTLRQLKDNGILSSGDMEIDTDTMNKVRINGMAAISKKTSDELYDSTRTHLFLALPFYGKTPDDNWLFTYPVFSLAMANNSGGDNTQRQACIKVLTTMLDEQAQEILNENGEGLISYNKGKILKLSPSMELVRPLIEKEKYFLRILNSNAFAASRKGFEALFSGADNKAFCSAINAVLFKQKESKEVAASDIAAANERDINMCSPSSSIIAQIVKKETSADIVIIDSRESMSPIYKTKYTDTDINALVMNGETYTATLNGEDLEQLMKKLILYTTTFTPGLIEPYIDYPAMAGVTADMKKDGTLNCLHDENGAVIKDKNQYRIVISARILDAMKIDKNQFTAKFLKNSGDLGQIFFSGFISSKGTLPHPSEYFRVQ